MPFPDPRATPRKVTVPTTMVWSDGDAFVGPWPVRRTEEWVDAPYRLVTLDGVSHWIPTHAPEALAAAVLERVRGR
ncbi:alpha/beta hydrolase [Nocardioides sp. TF02-7]|uniref:alpha/beta fold hydrolase n=1 Tax=Nocardioides sp. TF02-7 TaxID=2917724 RepID=UPI001F06D5A3|nr:alpha/beta hydrolase [Nocardioides sp. TF02-7]UMG93645.1 alpha/beta hydrolase [Nocardioides sp. TF02-7]